VTPPFAARVIVVVAGALALAVLVSEVERGTALAAALTKAGLVAGLVMVLGGLGGRLWAGAIVTSAQLPGGTGLAFAENSASIADLEEDLSHLEEETRSRLLRLERDLLGPSGNGDGGTMQ
jgi:hypothetical protein